MANKVLVIVGMQRSGTSLISQWLYKCGLHIGEEFLGPGVGNAEGHFEDLDFLRLHEEILQENSLTPTGLIDHPLPGILMTLKEKLKNLIRKKNQANAEWGWKDPRTCLFLPVYHELLPAAFYLIIIRDFQAVVSSLINRMYNDAEKKYLSLDWFTGFWWKNYRKYARRKKLYKIYSELYLKVWINYNEEILRHIDKLHPYSYIVINFEALKANDRPVFFHLKNEWNFTLKYLKFKNVYKESMIGKAADIDPFIKDKTLLVKAKDIQNKFAAMISRGKMLSNIIS